ncbi:hypothetical protein FBUS_00970 [Fasciolopsis buskii]|uniref:Uncharacterized protein n=1 Tax=Fasciolopsis buskii TaxID=27845 RepID=A0A8E0VJT5_9TREM|nr:hypothetical protein FBUS_00970 [Fasciolopsis buski]
MEDLLCRSNRSCMVETLKLSLVLSDLEKGFTMSPPWFFDPGMPISLNGSTAELHPMELFHGPIDSSNSGLLTCTALSDGNELTRHYLVYYDPKDASFLSDENSGTSVSSSGM